MRRVIAALTSLLVCASALADPAVNRSVDLRDGEALAKLRESNPAHYRRIEKIIEGLDEEPARAAGDWLQANFGASNVDLSHALIRTSHPPKQVLEFTLDDTRYTMHVTRTDLVARARPAT